MLTAWALKVLLAVREVNQKLSCQITSSIAKVFEEVQIIVAKFQFHKKKITDYHSQKSKRNNTKYESSKNCHIISYEFN